VPEHGDDKLSFLPDPDALNCQSASDSFISGLKFPRRVPGRRAVRNLHPPQSDRFIYMPKAIRKYSLNEIVHEVNETLKELANPRASARHFLGAAIDTGAERSAIEWKQATIYCFFSSSEMKVLPRNRLFKFGDQTIRSMGKLNLNLPVPNGVLDLYVDEVKPDIPLLVGFDLMDNHRIQFLNVSNELEHIDLSGSSWRMPVSRKCGHGFLECEVHSVRYNKSQLLRLHKNLYHPSTEKIINLLKRANHELFTSHTKGLLEEIVKACHACQTFASSPILESGRHKKSSLIKNCGSTSYFWKIGSS
jgi:hypothetical protein